MQNALLDKSIVPYDQLLEEKLGQTFQYYAEINQMTDDFDKEWKFYGKKYGWKYKIGDDKLLLELTAFDNAFLVVIAIKENEWADFLSDDNNKEQRSLLDNSGLKTDSFGLKIIIRDEKTFNIAKLIIEFVISERNS